MGKQKQSNAALRKETFIDIFIGAMLFIVSGIMPLVVRGAIRPTPPELWDLIVQQERVDAFAYWRSWFLIVPALIIAIYFFSELLTGGRKGFNIKLLIKNPPVVAAAVYTLFVVLSAVVSPYPYTALYGTVDRFEGLFVQLAYVVVFFTVMYYAHGTKQVNFVLAGVIFSSLLMGAVGLSQMLGHDFFGTQLGSIYITGEPDRASPIYSSSYGMLFNPNTYGLYSSMLAPFLLIGGFTYKGKKLVNLLLLAAGALMLAGIPGSGSLGGFLGAAAAVMIVAAACISNRIYNKKLPHKLVLVVIGVVGVCCVAAYVFVDTIKESVNKSLDRFATAVTAEAAEPLYDYVFDGATLRIENKERLWVSFTADGLNITDNWLTVRDGEGRIVEVTQKYDTEDGTQSTYYYEVPDYPAIYIVRNADHFILEGMFLAVVDGDIIPFRKSGISIDIKTPIPAWGFKGYEAWGSGRGYIWSRSFPVMLRHVILGSGPDSYINEFPQDDIIGKKLYCYDPYMIVDKAHSLYIQTGITTGGVSLLALVFLLGHYMVTTFLRLMKSRGESLYTFGLRLGTLAAVSAFAVSSIATDSTIPSTGMFYVLLGLGYALNTKTTNV